MQAVRPYPVTTVDSGSFGTSKGIVHLVLGGGGTSAPLDAYGADPKDGLPEAKVFTFRDGPIPSSTPHVYAGRCDVLEDATWPARQNTAAGYGIGVSGLGPGRFPGDQTSIKYRNYQALNADPATRHWGSRRPQPRTARCTRK